MGRQRAIRRPHHDARSRPGLHRVKPVLLDSCLIQPKNAQSRAQYGRRIAMSRKNTIVVNHNPGDPLPDTNTDWSAIDAMTDADIQIGIAADPDAKPITDEDIASGRVRPVVNVKRLREGLSLTQEEFAARYRIPV